ncbi:Major Facilitator Superfamily protein [Asanoa hainanensis]|uniref:Major Facilitator Superfamily protein n=1 Tax=Asanoa hainanensis TaxID=560556 RepID=A0A239J6I5_9ACTN|nr:MFS transporter [Asanoa hainanensis]SNT00863.1 Major Facilitator Superfamily protein [Asanoa hainanensis]
MTVTAIEPETRLFDRRYALATAGSTSLVFLAAFEALAVTTVMPTITAELDGRSLYSVAFVATTAANVVGSVAAGAWADRRGPRRALLVAIVVFAAGLAVAGTAGTMGVFVAGRFLQGLGAGGITVALYVLIAAVYPAVLHPRIFGLFAAAWVVPSMVGPFVAGLVADAWSWHWVFLGVLVLVAAATLVIVPVLRSTVVPSGTVSAGAGKRIAAAAVVAVAAVTAGLSSELPDARGWLVVAVAVALLLASVRTLLPPGTLRARPGLPGAVLLSAAAGGTFFSTEVYLPLLLHDRYGLPGWLSGFTLTVGAIAWAAGSHVQGRIGDRWTDSAVLRLGALFLATGAAAELVTALVSPHWLFVGLGWLLAGSGMGLMYPRVSTLVLAASEPGTQGFNTAAKSIADVVGGSLALALAGLLFQSLAGLGAWWSFAGTLTLSTLLGAAAVLVARRV